MKRVVGFLLVVLAALGASRGQSCRSDDPGPDVVGRWRESDANPVIAIGDGVPHTLWNDPSVLWDDGGYRMWLSGGDPREPANRISVALYEARSSDGVSWTIAPKPRVLPSPEPRAWDGLRVETPTVVKVDDVYHLYYSGANEASLDEGIYAIGHATSADGVRWAKDPENPVVTGQFDDPHRWGYKGVGEPGALFDPESRRIFLYYVGMRFSNEDPSIGHVGVLLATSRDGSKFRHHVDSDGERVAVLTRNIEHATTGSWFGYSTPSAVRVRDRVYLFVAFLVAPGGPEHSRHVALARATSADGVTFVDVLEPIMKTGEGDWKDHQVRSPTVVARPRGLEMWFAGETRTPHFGAGIGFAVQDEAIQQSP